MCGHGFLLGRAMGDESSITKNEGLQDTIGQTTNDKTASINDESLTLETGRRRRSRSELPTLFESKAIMPTIVRKTKSARVGSHACTNTATASARVYDLVDERVETATQSLERGVQKCLRQFHHRNQLGGATTSRAAASTRQTDQDVNHTQRSKAIRQVLLHIRHCWTHLRHNLTVLAAGMKCFRDQLLPSLPNHLAQQLKLQSSSDAVVQPTAATTTRIIVIQVLQHVFQSLLRLHDGYILTVSGECRHAADIATAQQTLFPSRLNRRPRCRPNNEPAESSSVSLTLEESTYSTNNTYSGTSWDEWFDPHRGLRYRLYTLLRPYLTGQHGRHNADEAVNAFWDDWSELGHPAAPLEAVIVETEHQMKQLQSQFTEWRCGQSSSNVTRTLQRALESVPHSHSHARQHQTSRHDHDTTGTPAAATVKVTLDWTDKMEQLIVVSTLTGGGKLKLERYADNFQVRPGMSVLPARCTAPNRWWNQAEGGGGMEWERVVPTKTTLTSRSQSKNAAPANNVTRNNDSNVVSREDSTVVKRRKIIDDSSDEEKTLVRATGTNNASNAITLASTSTAATGLIVKVIDAEANNPKHEAQIQSSVNDIKLQCGVNVEHMEAAFDTLQVEEAGAVREAELIDNAPEDASFLQEHNNDESFDILQAEKRVRQRKRALRKAMDHLEYTDLKEAYDAIWNTRDSLREAMMQVGELILWSDPTNTTLPQPGYTNTSTFAERERMLLKSIQYFDDASRLVAAQQKLHVTTKQKSTSPMDLERANYYRRNLLLLSGQARTNVGIATLELVRQSHFVGNPDRKRRLRLSCQILDGAIESAKAMKIASMEDSSGDGSDPTQCRIDSFSAMQLEALALRWKATALWQLYQLPEAYAVFIAASSVYENGCSENTQLKSVAKQQREVNAALDCRVECYHALTTLADVALTCLKQVTILQLRGSPEKYEILLDFVDRAISKAASQATAIQLELGVNVQQLCTKEVMASDELTEYWNDVQAWWDAKKEASRRNILKDLENSSGELPPFKRSDLPSSFVAFDNTAKTTQRFLAGQPIRRQSKYNLGGVGFSNAGNSATNVECPQRQQQQRQPPPRQYRKWREDMIIDKTTGEMVPQLKYPSIAPEMPPHIRAIYERKFHSH